MEFVTKEILICLGKLLTNKLMDHQFFCFQTEIPQIKRISLKSNNYSIKNCTSIAKPLIVIKNHLPLSKDIYRI